MIDNYLLRALEPEDFTFLKSCENDVDFWETSGTVAPWNDYSLKQHILQSGQDVWKEGQLRLIFCHKSKKAEALGIVDLFEVSAIHRRAHVGIIIKKEEQGKGLGQLALSLLCTYAFGILKMNQLRADIAQSNQSSIRLFEHQGFQHTGTLKNWNYKGLSEFEDVQIYQKLRAI